MSGKAAAREAEERAKGRSLGPSYSPAAPSPAVRWGALGDCRAPLQSAPGPGEGSPGGAGCQAAHWGWSCSQAGPQKTGSFLPVPKGRIRIWTIAPPPQSYCGQHVCKQPGLRNQHHVEPVHPKGLSPTPLYAGGPNERAFTQECAQPGRGPGPQQPCNLMNCQHLGRNCWALD